MKGFMNLEDYIRGLFWQTIIRRFQQGMKIMITDAFDGYVHIAGAG